jgi:hypothetical protein
MTGTSLFCTLGAGRIVLANELAAVIRDDFPVSPGHTLIIPKRHVGSFFDFTGEKRRQAGTADVWTEGLRPLTLSLSPQRGERRRIRSAALRERCAADREDPRGGVRWILPQKAKYWP